MINKNDEFERFINDYQISLETSIPYPKMIEIILKMKGYTVKSACDKAGIDTRKYYRIKSGLVNQKGKIVRYGMHLKDLIKIAIACELDMTMVQKILKARGLWLDETNKNHCAYIYIISRHLGKSIEECNAILTLLNVDEEYLLIKELA